MKINIVTTAGTDAMELQDVEIRRQDKYYGEPTTEAIDGFLWPNLDTFFSSVKINYNASIEPDKWRAAMNHIATDILAGLSSIIIVVDGQQLAVVPEENFITKWQYAQTIGFYLPSVTFNAATEGVPIGARYVLEGYVTEGYV